MLIQRIVVDGDSAPWGQGLLPEHKYANLLATALAPAAPHQAEIYAHSCAIIDALGTLGDDVAGCSPHSREIPLAAPTIRSQLRSVPDPEKVDLASLNRGINEADVHRIFNPLTSPAELKLSVEEPCCSGMKTLLMAVVPTTGFFAALGH